MLQRWRDQFIADASRVGITVEDARRLLSKAATLQRLAEAQCNGDWPADNGERETAECSRCGSYWAPSVIKKAGCPECRTEDAVKRILPPAFRIEFQGDPRGCLMTIKTVEGQEIGVPS
jgi:predicted Zn-ribbon and HTH transcriptional regulator